jgi:hypothetical protein
MQTEAPIADPRKPKRRWFQFSLRTMMFVVTLAAFPCGYVGWQAKIVRERKAMLDRITRGDQGSFVTWAHERPVPPNDQGFEAGSVPLVRRVLGDMAIICIRLPADTDIEERRRIHAVFPDALLVGAIRERTGNVENLLLVPFKDETGYGETKY